MRRVVLLGASNLTNGIGTVLATALQAFGQPLEVLAALGHGRSYGRSSRVFGRQLPGILQCGLWRQMTSEHAGSTSALVTDIGNDLLYEEPVERIAGWIEECFDRLAGAGARTIVTLLPLDNLPMLSRARFALMRSILVPRCRLSLEEVTERGHALNDLLRRLAAERGFGLAAQRARWYGFDPVHIRLRERRRAWCEILSGWPDCGPLTPAQSAWTRTLHLRMSVPERRRLWGFEQRGIQPAARYGDGTTVAIY